jgi:uncharacterized protein YbaR (Trm112 family)
MATLTLKISTLTSSIEVSDANATRVLESAFALFHQNKTDEDSNPVVYTAKQRLDWIVKVLIPQMLVDKARQYEEQRAIRDAQKAAAADTPKFG